MNRQRLSVVGVFGGGCVLCAAAALCAEPPGANSGSAAGSPSTPTATAVPAKHRVSVDVARDRAKVMHDVYAATLDAIHHRYFRGDRDIVPARAMEDVFAEMKRQSKVEARWISVNLKAMSIDHEPQSDFEKQAAKEIAAGKLEVEAVEGGFYRRAGAIPLAGECISCHAGFFRDPPKTPRFAGLVISVPVIDDPDTKHPQ
jgi:hypothetical protein